LEGRSVRGEKRGEALGGKRGAGELGFCSGIFDFFSLSSPLLSSGLLFWGVFFPFFPFFFPLLAWIWSLTVAQYSYRRVSNEHEHLASQPGTLAENV